MSKSLGVSKEMYDDLIKYSKAFQESAKDVWDTNTRKELLAVAKGVYDRHTDHIDAKRDKSIVAKTLLPDATSRLLNNNASTNDISRILKGVYDNNISLNRSNERSRQNSLNQGHGRGL